MCSTLQLLYDTDWNQPKILFPRILLSIHTINFSGATDQTHFSNLWLLLVLLNIFYFSVCLTYHRLYWIEDQLANVPTRFSLFQRVGVGELNCRQLDHNSPGKQWDVSSEENYDWKMPLLNKSVNCLLCISSFVIWNFNWPKERFLPENVSFLHKQLRNLMKGLMTLNPLPPKSDQHLTSPYNISPESYTRVIRIMKMITN